MDYIYFKHPVDYVLNLISRNKLKMILKPITIIAENPPKTLWC